MDTRKPPPVNADLDAHLQRVIATLAAMRNAQERLEHEVIALINRLDVSWDRIGEAHDPPISRQAARKRYSHPKPRRFRS